MKVNFVHNVTNVTKKKIINFMDNIIIKNLLQEVKEKSFVKGYKATDEEAMGLLISKYFEWDGTAIMKVAVNALEDANFRTEAEVINNLIK